MCVCVSVCHCEMQWSSGSRICLGADHGEHRARAYNGGLGAEPPAGSRSEPQLGSGRRSPLKLKGFFHFHTKEGPKVKSLNESI